MATRKPKIELYWASNPVMTPSGLNTGRHSVGLNWRLVGGNGEVMCQCTQGFANKSAALESIDLCGQYLFNSGLATKGLAVSIVGPAKTGKKS